MADTTTQIAQIQNAIVLTEPGPNEIIRVELGEQPLQFQFDLDSATFSLDGNDLVISFANGGQIIVEDYVTEAPLGAGSIVTADGSNEVDSYSVDANEALILNFDPAAAQIEVDGNNLVLVFQDGGRIVLENFFAPGGESGSTPFTLLSNGSLLSGELITALAVGIIPAPCPYNSISPTASPETVTAFKVPLIWARRLLNGIIVG